MAGRENEDNSIELINTENQIETNIPQYMLNINPAAINHSVKNQAEADHDRASLNALKVAFNSLQGYHNEQAKKLFSLQKKYSRLQEYVQSTQGSVDLRFLEESYPQDQPSMAQAAGAYNESHNQDFGNTLLKRELMKNAINNQELHAKNQRINELEKDYKYILLEKERLHGDVEALSIVLSEKKNEIAARDRDLKQLNQKITLLQAELELKQSLEQENEHLRQRIELYEHSGAFNERDQEKEELRMRLNNVQEECRRLVGVYEEQNKNLDAKDKEITRLQSQCKQFEIENSIFRSQRNEGNDFTDSGTNAELEKALELVKKQSGEIRVLKQSAEQQQNVIQQLLDNVKQNGNFCFNTSGIRSMPKGYIVFIGSVCLSFTPSVLPSVILSDNPFYNQILLWSFLITYNSAATGQKRFIFSMGVPGRVLSYSTSMNPLVMPQGGARGQNQGHSNKVVYCRLFIQTTS